MDNEFTTFIFSTLSKYGVPEKPITELTVWFCAHLVTTARSLISSLTAWWTSSIKIDNDGNLPIKLRSSFACRSLSSSLSSNIFICPCFSWIRSRITFSALVTATRPNNSESGWWLAIFWTFGFFVLFDFFAVLLWSNTSKEIILLMSVAAGSGRIHDGLKFCIVLRLGTTDDFKPDGANMIKLCANDGFVGSS